MLATVGGFRLVASTTYLLNASSMCVDSSDGNTNTLCSSFALEGIREWAEVLVTLSLELLFEILFSKKSLF